MSLDDGDRLAELHLELAGVHTLLPQVGERCELGALAVFHMQGKVKLREYDVQPAALALFQEIDEREVFPQPTRLCLVIQGEVERDVPRLVSRCKCGGVFLALLGVSMAVRLSMPPRLSSTRNTPYSFQMSVPFTSTSPPSILSMSFYF